MSDQARVITDENTKVRRIVINLQPRLNNPYFVENDNGDEIGTAVLDYTSAGIEAELFLDHHTPERLDFENEPTLLDVQLDMEIDPEFGLIGRVVLGRR